MLFDQIALQNRMKRLERAAREQQKAAAAFPVLSYTSAATPVIQTVLTNTETYASAATDWTYASSQHSNLTVPLVLTRFA